MATIEELNRQIESGTYVPPIIKPVAQTAIPAKKTIAQLNAELDSDTYIPPQTKVQEREEMIAKGEPVSSQRRFERTGKVEPSFGGSIARAIASLPLRIAASGKAVIEAVKGKRPEETEFKSQFPEVNQYFGKIEAIGKGFDPTQGFTESNLKAIKDAAGAGAEIASYLIGAKPLTTVGEVGVAQLSKQAIKQKILNEALRIAKYEAAAGGVGAGGAAMQQGKDLKGIITDALVGAGFGGILGGVIGGVGAKIGAKEISKIAESVSKKAEVPTVAPKAPEEALVKIEDLNKKLNQENTAKTVQDTLEGKREDLRLDNEIQMRRSKDYGAIPEDATPDTEVPIYRVGKEGTPIKEGDHISTNKEAVAKYLDEREGSVIIEDKTPLKNLVKSDGAGNEFVYGPKKAAIIPEGAPSAKIEAEVPNEQASRAYKRLQAELPEILEEDVNYTPIKLREDADRAVELIKTDKEKAFRIAMEAESSPEVTSTAVNIAMAEKALQDKNYSMFGQLTKTRSLAQTRRGQEIVSEKGSVTDNSTARYVKQLISDKMNKLGNSYLSSLKEYNPFGKKETAMQKATNIIKKEVEKAKKKISLKEMDIKEAQSFLDSLACK